MVGSHLICWTCLMSLLCPRYLLIGEEGDPLLPTPTTSAPSSPDDIDERVEEEIKESLPIDISDPRATEAADYELFSSQWRSYQQAREVYLEAMEKYYLMDD